MNKVLLSLSAGLIVLAGLAVAWYFGGLADFYAQYPDREPLVTSAPNYAPLVIAHRGYAQAAPENTVAAIRAAIADNLDYVEIDIRVTADGIPVLLHDGDVDRTTDGEGFVADYQLAELQQLDAGSWFAAEYAGTRVPTLEEALEAARGKICVMADVKATPNRRVVQQLRSFGEQAAPYCLLINFKQSTALDAYPDADIPAATRKKMRALAEAHNRMAEETYRVFRRYWPEFPLVRILHPDNSPEEVLEIYPSLIGLEISGSSLSEDRVLQAHELGLFTFFRAEVKPLDAEPKIRRGLIAGVDGFFVSEVDRFRELLSRFRQEAGS